MKPITQLLASVWVSVLQWIYTFGTKLCLKIKPFPDNKVIVMKVDELLQKRSKKFGFLKLMIVMESHSLIGNVVIVFMPHSKNSLTDSEHEKFLFYCRDYARSFHTIIPAGKEKTFSISQNNSRNRQGFARFRRNPLENSRLLQMIEITIGIF